MFGVARSMKDGALAMALKSYLNERIGEYGEVLGCELNTDANSLSLEVLLKGEDKPIVFAVREYRIERSGHHRYVVLDEIACSRPWLAALLNRFIAGKRWAVPAVISRLL